MKMPEYMKKSDMAGYDAVLPRLLQAVPEIREEYERMKREYDEARLLYTQQDVLDMEEIARLHGLRDAPETGPGLTIVFDNILLPFLLTLTVSPQQTGRLTEIMTWLEELASSPNFQVRNLINVTLCEALLSTNSDYLPTMFPFMGEYLRHLMRIQFEHYNLAPFAIGATIKKLLFPL